MLAAAAFADAACAAAETFAKGVVFHDRNRDGAPDRFEFGIGGVAVSNGTEVVRTDWRGRFRIPAETGEFVFVVKPSDWQTPVDADRLPRFYQRWNGSSAPLHFGLRRQREPRAFRAVVMGDPQVYDAQQLDWFARDIVTDLIGTQAALGISLGDLVGDDLSLLEPLNRTIARIGIPWYSAIGNHDLDFGASSDAESSETWQRIFGPTDFAFEYARAHFIVLDDVVYQGAKADGSTGGYHGGVNERQLAFVSNYLAGVEADRLVVLIAHIPFDSPPYSVARSDELLGLLDGRPNTLSLVAHMHFLEHQFLGAEHGAEGTHHQFIAGAASGSWWLGSADEDGIPHATMRCGAPNGYAMLDVDDNRFRIHYRAARRPESHQMIIHAPASGAPGDRTEILVNVFNGSEKSRVRLRLDDGEWTELAREARPDPAYLEVTDRDQLRSPRPKFFVPPVIGSPHLWVGEVALPIEPGVYALEVEAELQPGQDVSGRRLLRVIPATDETP